MLEDRIYSYKNNYYVLIMIGVCVCVCVCLSVSTQRVVQGIACGQVKIKLPVRALPFEHGCYVSMQRRD